MGVKPKTIIRKAKQNLDHLAIVSDYAQGELSVSEIAARHKTTPDNVALLANRFWKSLTNMRESRALLGGAETTKDYFDARNSLEELQSTELINEAFLNKLSPNGSALLTDEESTYCWVFVHTGSMKEALKLSTLDEGLYVEKKRDSRFSYDRALVLRGLYLNAKPNITAYIKELRETRLIDADVGQARIQSELIDQIEQMKSSSNPNRGAIIRAIELLGRTVGSFVDRVEVREINPADSLDLLIEMAKDASVKPKELSQ